ncbi:hypothetical protein CBL_10296 [Carabus blaptoides fortunei]
MSNSDEDTLTRKMDVAPQGCMSLQEDISVPVDFNTMLRFLDFKDIIFKIRVGRKCVKCKKCATESAWPTYKGWCCKHCAPAARQCKFSSNGCFYTDVNSKASKHEVFYFSRKTTKCQNCVDKCVWPTNDGWCCEDCAPARRVCKFESTGCSYLDTCLKVNKHERLFCEHSNYCDICRNSVTARREQHYMDEHSDLIYEAGVTARAQVEDTEKYIFLVSDVGEMFLFCFYILKRTKFTLGVCAPLNVQQISQYRCIVKLTNPVTGHTVRHSLKPSYTSMYDWVLHINKDVFSMYSCDNCTTDIQIELVKK